jgi:hypothetical protein
VPKEIPIHYEKNFNFAEEKVYIGLLNAQQAYLLSLRSVSLVTFSIIGIIKRPTIIFKLLICCLTTKKAP